MNVPQPYNPAIHLPPPAEFNPSHGVGPSFSLPVTHSTNEDDNKSVASMDDFEMRLAALKKL